MTIPSRRRISTLIVSLLSVLATAFGVVAAGGVQADPPFTKRFEWTHDIKAGDCTMFAGAAWEINRDGTAHFKGSVTSGDDNDAWLMHAQLLGANRRYLANIIAQEPGVDDIGRFVQNLPDSSQRYYWEIDATFDAVKFDGVESINLQSHC